MEPAGIFFCSHITSRLMMGGGLMLFAISTRSFMLATGLCITAAAMMRMLDGNWLTTLRLLRLLRWFVIPILLLHLLFTPGQLLLPGWSLPVSREGLRQGAWLSLHLVAIYAVAMLMFRLLRRHEWLGLLKHLPKCGESLLIRALMLMSMKKQMAALLSLLRQQYRLRSSRKQLPLLLMAAFRCALADATAHAQALWLRWPQQPFRMLVAADESCDSGLFAMSLSLLMAVCGSAGLLSPWWIG